MFEQFKLDNGFPVILAPKKDSESLTLLVVFKVGSRYEDTKLNHGVSHFIEHLMFKGTKSRPTSLDISKILDGIGAEFNAYTSKDHTGYYIKVNAEKFAIACDVLADMLTNSLFDAQEIDREKGVIIEEIKMWEDQPIQHTEVLFEELLFGSDGNSLGPRIAGTEESIVKMTQADILDYRNSFYEPQNGVIVVSGKIPEDIKDTLSKFFTQLNEAKQKKFAQKFAKFENRQKEPRVHLEFRDTQQAHLALGFPAYAYGNPDLYAFYLLAIILGGTMSSRLFINVRERKGLCYFIKAQADVYEDTGDLMIRAGLLKDKIKEAITLILQELSEIKNNGITDEELQTAKENLKGRSILDFEASEHLADFYARQFLLAGELLTPEDKIKKILAVTKEQVNNVAKDILKEDKINLTMISPFKDEAEFKNLLKL